MMYRSGRLEKDMGTGKEPRIAHENHDTLSQTRKTDYNCCTINCNVHKFESFIVKATVIWRNVFIQETSAAYLKKRHE